MLEITDAARDKLKSLLKNYPGKCLRLVIEGVG
jgi:Fe-S cluster assembly iron-binding protein IscA